MLDDLVHVIETLQQRTETHRQSLEQNEIRTRVALIDPLLSALGWDVSDPVLVTPEYTVGEGRADYALNGSESIPAAIVEAKRLGHALSDDERMQMLNYANARGVRYAAITDGNAWELYEVFKQAPLEERRLLRLRIFNTPSHELALQLLLLWRPNLASGQPAAAQEPVLLPMSNPAALSISPTPIPSPATHPSVVPLEDVGWCAVSSFVVETGDAPPRAIRFPNGTEHQVQRWIQLVQHTVHWLWSEALLTETNVPINSSPQRFIVNKESVHPTGRSFNQRTQVTETPFVIEGNTSSKAALSKTKTLLQHCGVSPDTVHVQMGE